MEQLTLFNDESPSFEGLSSFDIVIVNTSGGKDSICAIWKILQLAKKEGYPKERIFLSHQDLQQMEWPGVKELVAKQAEFFGLQQFYSTRKNKDGVEQDMFDHVLQRGMWPSPQQRWCTSDYKRGPGGRVLTQLARENSAKRVLYIFGFRAQESPGRKKKPQFYLNKTFTTKSREVYDYLPIQDWTVEDVWACIRGYGIPYHYAYDLGMPRLSCVFCIYAPQEALMLAAHHNPDLFDRGLDVEGKTGHNFSFDFSLHDIMERLEKEGVPKLIKDWKM